MNTVTPSKSWTIVGLLLALLALLGLALLVFAGFHTTQGTGGMLLALLLGGVLSWLYL